MSMEMKLLAVITLIGAMILGPPVSAIPIGASGGDGSSTISQYEFDETIGSIGAWILGSEEAPVEVFHDADAGVWEKQLSEVNANEFVTVEYLEVYQDPAFTDWHIEILNEGWTLGGVAVSFLTDPGIGVGDLIIGDTFADILFGGPIPTGTQFLISTSFSYGNGDFNGSVSIAQYPTIPEPSIFALLSFGLFGFGYMRRKMKV